MKVPVISADGLPVGVDNVTYTVKVYGRFEGGQLLDELASGTGVLDHVGFYTIDLSSPVVIAAGDDFYVYLSLSSGGMPYDRTSDVPVLLGAGRRLFPDDGVGPVELELTRRLEGRGVTHLRYVVRYP